MKQILETKSKHSSDDPLPKKDNKGSDKKFFLNDEANLNKYIKILISTCCEAPAKILNIQSFKGTLRKGMCADLVVWDPHTISAVQNSDVFLAYKDVYIMKGQRFYGKTIATYLRGNLVYKREKKGNHSFFKCGNMLFPKEK